MNKKLIKILVLALIMLIAFTINSKSNADELKLNVETQKHLYNLNKRNTQTRNEFNIGEKIIFTVGWDKPMQASGFEIECEFGNEQLGDSNVLEFIGASIGENFYNITNTTDGKKKISVEWASFEEEDRVSIDFEFRAINKGVFSFNVSSVTAFADGNLNIPTEYDNYNANKLVTVVKYGDYDNDGEITGDDYSVLQEYLNRF